ncbi:MAG: hypothetical protein AB8H12_01325 [Lewinella sp.]
MITTVKVVPCLLREHNAATQLLAFLNPPPLEDFQLPLGPAESTENLEAAALRHLRNVTGIGQASVHARIGTLEVICPANSKDGAPRERQFWKVYHVNSEEVIPETWDHPADSRQPDKILRYFWHDLRTDESHISPQFRSVLKLIHSYAVVLSVRKSQRIGNSRISEGEH